MKHALIMLVLFTSCAAAQVMEQVDNRMRIFEARVHALDVESDSTVLLEIPSKCGVYRVTFIPEDSAGTVWQYSANVVLATQYGDLFTWERNDEDGDKCFGCNDTDIPATSSKLMYNKGKQTLVLRYGGITGTRNGSLRIVVVYFELY